MNFKNVTLGGGGRGSKFAIDFVIFIVTLLHIIWYTFLVTKDLTSCHGNPIFNTCLAKIMTKI